MFLPALKDGVSTPKNLMNFETEKKTLADTIRDPHAEDPIDSLIRQEMGRKISAAVKRLPPQQQKAFLLTTQDGLTYAEAGKIMGGISENTVKTHFQTAKKFLVKLLENYAAEFGIQRKN